MLLLIDFWMIVDHAVWIYFIFFPMELVSGTFGSDQISYSNMAGAPEFYFPFCSMPKAMHLVLLINCIFGLSSSV